MSIKLEDLIVGVSLCVTVYLACMQQLAPAALVTIGMRWMVIRSVRADGGKDVALESGRKKMMLQGGILVVLFVLVAIEALASQDFRYNGIAVIMYALLVVTWFGTLGRYLGKGGRSAS